VLLSFVDHQQTTIVLFTSLSFFSSCKMLQVLIIVSMTMLYRSWFPEASMNIIIVHALIILRSADFSWIPSGYRYGRQKCCHSGYR